MHIYVYIYIKYIWLWKYFSVNFGIKNACRFLVLTFLYDNYLLKSVERMKIQIGWWTSELWWTSSCLANSLALLLHLRFLSLSLDPKKGPALCYSLSNHSLYHCNCSFQINKINHEEDEYFECKYDFLLSKVFPVHNMPFHG